MLKEIHRSSEDMWWTESCLRLRDFTCTKEQDCDFWRLHDLDRGHLMEEQKEYFENKALSLCARCEDVGARNGRKLAHLAESERKIVHQIRAESNKSVRKPASTVFDGMRDVIHLVRECKVMLTRNVTYLYGLANGTRGTLVGVVYGPGGVGLSQKCWWFASPITVGLASTRASRSGFLSYRCSHSRRAPGCHASSFQWLRVLL